MSTYRYDPLEKTWVIIAPHRLKKPTLHVSDIRTVSERCPFCEGNEALSDGEIDVTPTRPERTRNTPGWTNRVIANRYKAVAIEANNEVCRTDGALSRGGFGAHEILIDTPLHEADLSTMPANERGAYLGMIRKRIVDLRRDGRIAYISVFKNVGVLAGETMQHPHTQILAYPIVPSHIASLHSAEEEYYAQNRRHLLLDEVALSIEQNDRLVWIEGDFCLYTPYASRNPFELRIAPRSVLGSLAEASAGQIDSLAALLGRSVELLKAVLGEKIAYNIVFRDAVSNAPGAAHTFHVNIVPRLFGIGGVENEDRMFINPMPPEKAAQLYKERL